MSISIELLLQAHDFHGLSMRQLKQKSGLIKRKIRYLFNQSNFIERTPSWIHGSWKQRINVYNYTSVSKLNRTKKPVQVEVEVEVEN